MPLWLTQSSMPRLKAKVMTWRTVQGKRSATEIERWMLACMIDELFTLYGVFDSEGFRDFTLESVGVTSRFSILSSEEQFVAVLQAALMAMDPMDLRLGSDRAIYSEALYICFKGWILAIWHEIEHAEDNSDKADFAIFNSCRRLTLAFFFCLQFNSLIDIAVDIVCKRRGISPDSSSEIDEVREFIRRELAGGEAYYYYDLLPTHLEEDKAKWQNFVEELIIDNCLFIDRDWLLPIYTGEDLCNADRLKAQCQAEGSLSSMEVPPLYFDVEFVREELQDIQKNFDKDRFYKEWIEPYLTPPPIALNILDRLGQRHLVNTEV
jgi:hypothetical protein